MGHDELGQLGEDIAILRAMIDAALDMGKDDAILHACAEILTERKGRLEGLEPSGLRERYERALP